MLRNLSTPSFAILAAMLLSACANKESHVNVLAENSSPQLTDANVKANLRTLAQRQEPEEVNDTSATDTIITSDCYRWDRQYTASTPFTTPKGDSYDLNIYFNLQASTTDHYTGGMVLYVDEDNFLEAAIEGEAEGNHITLFYIDDEENTTGDIFKNHDKLVMFDLADGEYHASWFSPMHRFIDENTVLSIK